MGGVIDGLLSYNDYGPSSPNESLRNRTFNIQGHSYTLLDRLGNGAFGSVWSSVTSNGRRAAVKAIDVSGRRRGANAFDPETLIQSFEKEIKMAYRMRQETQHVVTIFGFDFDPRAGLALMAMELGDDTLTKRVEKLHAIRKRESISDGTLLSHDYISSRDRKNIWVQLVNILQTLHRHRVVHCDMKPDNLVFFGQIVKIVDLGIAQKEMHEHDPNAPGIGSPYYSAPECFIKGGHITSKADIWSAGAILYYMTYGKPPIYGSAHPPPGSHRTRSAYVSDLLHYCLKQRVRERGSHRWLAQHSYTTNPEAF